MKTLAVDVGYSHVKAISSDGRRALIPSVVAPARELALADLSKNGVGHTVEIRYPSGDTRRYFVGDLALREGGQAATFTMDREKHLHPNHDILILAVARLLGAEPGSPLVAGLPVAYYRAQKDDLARHLMELHAHVSVDGRAAGRVSFGRAVVYPQGAGALLTAPELPETGLVCLVDVGYKTTDYVTAEVASGIARPVSTLCGSVETEVSALHSIVGAAYQGRAGAPVNPARLPEIVKTGKAVFRGREIDLSFEVAEARRSVARAVADQVLAALGDRADKVSRFYLAGGGAEALPDLENLLPGAVRLPEAQWANALGFLKAVC